MKDIELFDCDGERVELDDVQRVRLVCFKCETNLTEKGGILFSEPFQSYSDNVDYVKKFHLCRKCVREVLVFCGAVKFD